MNEQENLNEKILNIIKFNAAFEAVKLFAVWRDGSQWVNDRTCLKEVRNILIKQYNITEEDLK